MDRLDKLILSRYPDFSRSRIEGLIKAGFVTVNGATAEKAGMKVNADDDIVVEIPPPVPAIPEPEAIEINIVYEDDDMIVVNKAPGMVVHPAPGHFTGTLVNALLHHCPQLSGIGGVARPGIVHRLDQDTSGLIIVAKSQKGMDGLVRQFASHKSIEKTYLALCHAATNGTTAAMSLSGRIENLIGRHPIDRKKMAVLGPKSRPGETIRAGKLAITNWRIIPEFSAVNGVVAVECRIETGRTHQIRVHMASLGMPVIGDKVYGRPNLDRQLEPFPTRQMLHAWKLRLWHPTQNQPIEFLAPIPADIGSYLAEK